MIPHLNQFLVAEHAVVCANLCEATHTLRRILAIKPLLARWVRAFYYESMLRRQEGRRQGCNLWRCRLPSWRRSIATMVWLSSQTGVSLNACSTCPTFRNYFKQVFKSSCRAHQFEPARLRLDVPLSDLGETSYEHEETRIQSTTFW